MCVTNKRKDLDGVEKTGLFFAVYNTVFNLTEYVFEDSLIESESFLDFFINEDTNYVVILSEYNTKIKVRGFSLESKVLV
jgi:hypothetical protein